jgi:hypothetical protein
LILLTGEPAVLAYHTGELTESANLGKLRRQLGQRLTSFEKPTFTFISLGASRSGIPPQGAGGSSKPAAWEPIVLAYHNRELVVPANLWMKVAFYMLLLRGRKLYTGFLQCGASI